MQWGGIDRQLLVDRDKVHGICEFKRTWPVLMRVRICEQWSAPSLLAAGYICLFGKQPHHRPDFCLNRKQSVVQWKGPGSEHHLNPVWFGDKLKSTEGKIKEKGVKQRWTASYFPQLFYDFITATSGQITQQQQTFVIRADCLFKARCCSDAWLVTLF